MASGFTELIELRPRSHPWLTLYALAILGAGLWCLLRASLSIAWLAVLGPALGTRVAAGLLECERRGVCRALLRPSGDWQLETADGQLIGARLTHHWGELHGPVIGLEWCGTDRRRHRAWFLRADMSAVTWRRLRARLALA